MPPENFSETTQPLGFEAEYDDATNSDPLFLPDEEMDEDEGNINTMLMPFDQPFAANPQGGNQDMDSHSDELQPNPGERPMRNLPARARSPGQTNGNIFRFRIDSNVGSAIPHFEYQVGMKRVNEDVVESKDKRVRMSPVVQDSSKPTRMAKNTNQQLLHALQSNQLFIQAQSEALQVAQQKINDLQSAQKKADDDRAKLLKELQAIKAQKDMEVASAIQRGRETFAHKTAGTSSSNSRHQSTRPAHSLAPLVLCSSNATNGHLREGSSGPESSELRQGGCPTVDKTQANQQHHDVISVVLVDDNQGMQQDPLFDTPLPTPVIKNTTNKNTTMQEPQPQNSRVPPDVPAAATSEFPSRQVSQTPDLQRWSWVNARNKQRRERGKKRMTLTKLCSIQDEDEEFLDDIPPPNDEDFDADEDEDGEQDEENDDNGDNEESGRTASGVWLSERKLKSMMVDAAQTALRLQRKPVRKGQRNSDGTRKRRDALEEEKAGDQRWQRLIFMRYVRNVFEEKFDVRQDEDYTLHDPPTPQEVQQYALKRGPGPNPEDLRIDMKGKINSNWNLQVIDILLAELMKKDWDGLPQRSEAYLVDLIEGKLERVRTCWRNAQPKFKETGEVETIADVESRMTKKKDDQDRANRAYSRRRNRFRRRMTTLERILDIKVEEQASDEAVWRWLSTVVEKLGEDGMSSDESDTDTRTGLPIYRIKNMKWRRKMAYELDMVDKLRLKDRDIYSQKGAKPTARFRDDRNSESQRVAPKGLPKRMYSSAWLQGLTPQTRRKLMVSDEDFAWLNLLSKG